MEITGRIIAVLTPNSGVSQRTGNTWMSQDYVIETHDQYPRKCCFRIFGEDKIKSFNIQVGQELTVQFDIDCHEYNGRWFNDIRAWSVAPAQSQPAMGPGMPGGGSMPFPPAQSDGQMQGGVVSEPSAADANENTDDLPF